MPQDTEGEALAMVLYSIYWEAIGKQFWQWDELAPDERTAWIMVAQYVLAGLDNDVPDHK